MPYNLRLTAKSGSRVCLIIYALQSFGGKMSVYLRGRKIYMPQEFLDAP